MQQKVIETPINFTLQVKNLRYKEAMELAQNDVARKWRVQKLNQGIWLQKYPLIMILYSLCWCLFKDFLGAKDSWSV